MVQKFQGGVLERPAVSQLPADEALVADAGETVRLYAEQMEAMSLTAAIKTVWSFIGHANKYIDETAPWALAKDPAKKGSLAAVLYNLAESLRIISGLISPFLPQTAPKIWRQLGFTTDFSALALADLSDWGRFPAPQRIGEAEPLFPRIEIESEEKTASVSAAPKTPSPKKKSPAPKGKEIATETSEITIDEFSKIHLRVVKILAAEKVPETDKLLKLRVDLGNEQRNIVSGISQHYEPEQLIGKTVVMVVNLKPVKIRGILSQGMVLAASKDDQLKLLGVDMPVGSQVR